jgi:hypothetical protein
MTEVEKAMQEMEQWVEDGMRGQMPDLARVHLKTRVTLKKFDGDGASDPNAVPVDTLVLQDEGFPQLQGDA